nr:hypothetical protein [uncultured Desulfobulbus sp.]
MTSGEDLVTSTPFSRMNTHLRCEKCRFLNMCDSKKKDGCAFSWFATGTKHQSVRQVPLKDNFLPPCFWMALERTIFVQQEAKGQGMP